MVKATEDDTNTSPTRQLTVGDITSLAGRLTQHADGIENIAAQGMAQDMRLAAQAIEHLMRPTAEDMPIGKEPPEFVSITSVKALLNRLLDHGQASGDEALHHDIETAGRLIFTLWEIIERAGIKDPAIESTPTDLYVDVMGDDGTSRCNVPLREAIGNDPDEYEDCRQTLLADGKCTTGGGAFPLRHLELAGNDELARLRVGIRKAIDSTTDPVCRNHLRELLGGA